MTLEEWISRFDNEEADKLTQEEQLEIKSYLLTLLNLTSRRADNGKMRVLVRTP